MRSFVHDNRSLVSKDVRQLTRILGVLAKQKDELNTLTRIGALGLDNLTLAFDNKTQSIGSRLQATPNGANLGNAALRHRQQLRGFEKPDRRTRPVHLLKELLDAVRRPDRGRPVAEPEPSPAQIKLGSADAGRRRCTVCSTP